MSLPNRIPLPFRFDPFRFNLNRLRADVDALANRGTEDRIHLVIDCKVNDWLTATLEAAVHDPAQPGP